MKCTLFSVQVYHKVTAEGKIKDTSSLNLSAIQLGNCMVGGGVTRYREIIGYKVYTETKFI
jgi:hypothetical protein